jgi:hypothetical protein
MSRLRASEVADAIRERRLIAVLRRVAPRERLLELVEELAADEIRIFEMIAGASTLAAAAPTR